MMMEEIYSDKAVRDICERIQELELNILGNRKSLSERYRHSRSLIQRVEGLTTKCAKIKKKYPELAAVSELAKEGKSKDLEDALESPEELEAQQQVVLTSQDTLEGIASQLAQIKKLEEHVNPPYLQDIPQIVDRLQSIEAKYKRDSFQVDHLEQRVDRLLTHYDRVIVSLSQQFLLMDEKITKIEKKRAGDDDESY